MMFIMRTVSTTYALAKKLHRRVSELQPQDDESLAKFIQLLPPIETIVGDLTDVCNSLLESDISFYLSEHLVDEPFIRVRPMTIYNDH